jgi:CHAD domain-containing protein
MKIDSLPPDVRLAVSLQSDWLRQINIWRELLAKCLRKPNRKRIHDLRSFTLRLSVSLEYWLLVQVPDPVATSVFKRWNKEGKKLRRALRPARDADVYMARLDGLRAVLGGNSGRQSQLSPRCLREIDTLVSRLKQRRQAEIDELIAIIGASSKRLNRRCKEMEVALAPIIPSVSGSTAQAALRQFTGLACEFTDLDSANLHIYRKRLKPMLYLAEMSAAADPLAGRMAVAFRRIHLAIGEWHDWQTLAEEAACVLPDSGKQDGLVPVLETLAERTLQRALCLCRTARRSLMSAGSDRSSDQLMPAPVDRVYRPHNESLTLSIYN